MVIESSEKCRPWRWARAKATAAVLLAEDALMDVVIAAAVGVTDRTLHKWKKAPEFKERVEALAKEMGRVAFRGAIGWRNRRIRELDERWRQLLQVIAERAADPAMRDVPGGTTGLVIRIAKKVAGGVVYLDRVDTGLLRELRELAKQAAQELGQWGQQNEGMSKDGASPQVIILPAKDLPLTTTASAKGDGGPALGLDRNPAKVPGLRADTSRPFLWPLPCTQSFSGSKTVMTGSSWVWVHGPRVTAAQLRARCGSIKADLTP